MNKDRDTERQLVRRYDELVAANHVRPAQQVEEERGTHWAQLSAATPKT